MLVRVESTISPFSNLYWLVLAFGLPAKYIGLIISSVRKWYPGAIPVDPVFNLPVVPGMLRGIESYQIGLERLGVIQAECPRDEGNKSRNFEGIMKLFIAAGLRLREEMPKASLCFV